MTKKELMLNGTLKVVRNFIHSCKTTYLSIRIDTSRYSEDQIDSLIKAIQSPDFEQTERYFNLNIFENYIEIENYNLDDDVVEKDIVDEINRLYDVYYNLMWSYLDLGNELEEFMQINGLGEEDMINDITYPKEL